MQRLRVDPDLPDAPRDLLLEPAVEALRTGGVVIVPTDTLYGLAADPRDASAVEKIFRIKRRARDQPIPLIAESRAQVVECAGTITPLAERLASQWWPGPLTLVIQAWPELCDLVHQRTGKVAVRVPNHPVARALARAVRHPLTATSANESGTAPVARAEELWAGLGDDVDVLVDAGPLTGGLPSTIVDATGPEPILVRPGAVPWERVLKFLR